MDLLVDGIVIFYDAPRGLLSDDDHIPALFVHGAGGSSQYWRPMLPYLSKRICPLLVDLPGHGQSSGWVPSSIDKVVTFLTHFIDHVCPQEKIVCVGHSLGGVIAERLALTIPARIERLALIATAAHIRLHPDFQRAVLTNNWDMEMVRHSFGPSIPVEVQNMVRREFSKTRVAVGATNFMNLDDVDMRREVGSLSLPTVIITGKDDNIISPRHSRFLHREIRDSRFFEFQDAGHYVHIEQPRAVAEILNQFIESVGEEV